MTHHITLYNSFFAVIQLLLALTILYPATRKAGLAASIPWAIAVWWFGEGLGGILTSPTSDPFTGAPGAVILYAFIAVLVWPHHSGAEFVRLRHHRRVGDDKPLSLNAHAIAAVLGVPVDVLDTDAVGKRTAQALAARELVEPGLQRRIGVTAVIMRGYAAWNEHKHARCYDRQNKTGESVHSGLQMISMCGPRTNGPADPENSAHRLHVVVDPLKL